MFSEKHYALAVNICDVDTYVYWMQSTSCALALNEFAVAPEGSPDFPKSKITVELDTAHAAWVSHDVALLSTKTGNLLLLSLVYDGRSVQNLELSRSKASVLASVSMCTSLLLLGIMMCYSLQAEELLAL
jgi:cleavage and polyadenylation specificity factor subunit 1